MALTVILTGQSQRCTEPVSDTFRYQRGLPLLATISVLEPVTD